MKLKLKRQFIFPIALIVITLLNLFNLSTSLKVVLTLAVSLYSFYLIKKNGTTKFTKIDEQFAIITTFICLIYLAIFYLFGIKGGYENNLAVIYKSYISIFRHLFTILIIVNCEIIRAYTIKKDSDKKKIKSYKLDNIIHTIMFVLMDIAISYEAVSYSGLKQLYILFSIVILGSICRNLLLNYMITRFDIYSCLIYRTILELYILLIPVSPVLNEYIRTVLFIMYPYIFYIVIASFVEKKSIKSVMFKPSLKENISFVVWLILFVLIVGLVSREFKYSILAIGSESMTGAINKGDAIIYRTYDIEKDKPEEGDIIVFETEYGSTVVHRICDVYEINGLTFIKTKGDANKNKDTWTLLDRNIKGKYLFTIRKIGWPSIFISELF